MFVYADVAFCIKLIRVLINICFMARLKTCYMSLILPQSLLFASSDKKPQIEIPVIYIISKLKANIYSLHCRKFIELLNITIVTAGNSLLTQTTATESRLFGSVVEHWTFNPTAGVQIPRKTWDISA